jgi:hypothetical protein
VYQKKWVFREFFENRSHNLQETLFVKPFLGLFCGDYGQKSALTVLYANQQRQVEVMQAVFIVRHPVLGCKITPLCMGTVTRRPSAWR